MRTSGYHPRALCCKPDRHASWSCILWWLSILSVLSSPSQTLASQNATWRISETPEISIGGGSSGPASDLFTVRDVTWLRNGAIAIADGGRRVLVFDAEGNHLRTIGRQGNGPGEFLAPIWLQPLPGDTLLVFDLLNASRLSWFGPDGTFLRSVSARARPAPIFWGSLADGSLIGWRDHRNPDFGRPNARQVSWARGELELLRFDPGGRVLESLGIVPDNEKLDIPGFALASPRGSRGPVLQTVMLVGARRVYVSTSEEFAIRVISPGDGAPQVFRLPAYRTRPVTSSDLVQYFTGFDVKRFPPGIGPVDWNTVRWNVPEGRTWPPITNLLLDARGNLWAEEGGSVSAATRTWSILAPNGTLVAKATVPSEFEPFEIGEDDVLGVWRDELDVEFVQRRAIMRRD